MSLSCKSATFLLAVLSVGAFGAHAQVMMATEASKTATGTVTEAEPAPRVMELGEPPSAQAKKILDEVEKRHADLKTLQVEFAQEKTSKAFEEKIDSHGKLYLQMPDKLRCDYEDPEPSQVWFVDNVSYQVTPSIRQVDKFLYGSKEEAMEQLRLMLLGFGMSSSEVLQNYEVKTLTDPGSNLPGLVFRPLDPKVAKAYKDFRVWLDAEYLPRKVQYEEISGDITVLNISKVVEDKPLSEKIFRPDFPKSYDVIEHKDQ